MARLDEMIMFSISCRRYKVNNWAQKKKQLLDMVDADWSMSERIQDQEVIDCHTDYFSTNGRASYFDMWYNILKEDLDDALPQTGLPLANPEMWQLWTQKYRRGHYHGAHNHGCSNLSCILYVEFEKGLHEPTAFYQPFPDPWFGTLHKIQPQIEEGDILMFPAVLLHESPVSRSDKTRTVMSFNIPVGNFYAESN